jgi:hypothetical protein
MVDEEAKKLLLRIAESSEKILLVMTEPEKLGQKFMNWVGLGAGIVGIMSLVDMLKNWFGG